MCPSHYLPSQTVVRTSNRRCTKYGQTSTQLLKLLLLIRLTRLLRAINFLPGQYKNCSFSDEVREPNTLTSKYPVSYTVKVNLVFYGVVCVYGHVYVSMGMCLCIYMCIMAVHVCIYICVCVCVYSCMSRYACLYMPLCMCMGMCLCEHICIGICEYMYVFHVCIYIDMVCVYVCTLCY